MTKPNEEADEGEDMPARVICIQLDGPDAAVLEEVAQELGAILQAAAGEFELPDGITLAGMSVEDPDTDTSDDE